MQFYIIDVASENTRQVSCLSAQFDGQDDVLSLDEPKIFGPCQRCSNMYPYCSNLPTFSENLGILVPWWPENLFR